MKTYQVFYWIKKNCHEYLNHIFVNASTSKEACKEAKRLVMEKTGHNAFRPSTKPLTQEELAVLRNNSYYVVD